MVFTEEQWRKIGTELYGKDPIEWKFKCPSCGYIANIKKWKEVGAGEGEAAFSCIGRHVKGSGGLGAKPGPCDYAGGGLFLLNPVYIKKQGSEKEHRLFEFADRTVKEMEESFNSK